MFRQDRTNPSTAISNWRGRHDTPKGWPNTAVSTCWNGGLFGAEAFVAFGGLITQYTDSGTTYRVHTFRGSGSFEVASGEANVDYLMIAGGGGGGSGYGEARGGGGGGGGSRTADVTLYACITCSYILCVSRCIYALIACQPLYLRINYVSPPGSQ